MNVVFVVLLGCFVVIEAIQLGLVVARAFLFGISDALEHVEFDLTTFALVAALVSLAVSG